MDEVIEKFEETVVAELLIETPEAEKSRGIYYRIDCRGLYLRPPKKLTRLSLRKLLSSRLSKLYVRPLKKKLTRLLTRLSRLKKPASN